MVRLGEFFETVAEYGPGWVFWRTGWELMLRSGMLENQLPVLDTLPPAPPPLLPVISAFDVAAHDGNRHDATRTAADTSAVIAAADAVVAGRFSYWSDQEFDLGPLPNWFYSPETKREWPRNRHWSQIPEFGAELGDIKYIWELSRFRFVYPLARAYAATGDDRYAEAFWALVEAWQQANRPEIGPHWRCGQEMSLRVLAWLFGASVFRQAPASTSARIELLGRLVCYHVSHIEKVHWYARRCVRNNHAISEVVCLLTAGVCFPSHERAGRWREQALAGLHRELKWQIYSDGGYVQQSMNYARLVVQLLNWVLALADTHQLGLPRTVTEKGGLLLDFLSEFQDPDTGCLSNFGLNDGTLLFPLSNCTYGDFRPALNTLSLLLGRGQRYDAGPWDEEGRWFAGDRTGTDSQQAAVDRPVREYQHGNVRCAALSDSGYYHFNGPGTHGLLRCGANRHRPHEADMLHLDLWFHGYNVVIDPGTYSYNAPDQWRRYFSGTGAHNTLTVNGDDQMRRGSRFLWHRWVYGEAQCSSDEAGGISVRSWCRDYRNLVHRRAVRLRGSCYLIHDEIGGRRITDDEVIRLHWLFPLFDIERDDRGGLINLPGEGGKQIRIICAVDCQGSGEWVKGDSAEPRGWRAPGYGKRTEAWSYTLSTTSPNPVFTTMIGPPDEVAEMMAR